MLNKNTLLIKYTDDGYFISLSLLNKQLIANIYFTSMKKTILFSLIVLVLFNCTTFETNKDKLDRIIETYLNDWKEKGKDSNTCIIDFNNIMPFEWDCLVYVYCIHEEKNQKIIDFFEKYEIDKTNCPEKLYFLNHNKIVHEVNLDMASDKEKGTFFCTRERFIERSKNDAKFYLVKKDEFLVIRDMSEDENLIPIWVDYFKDL